MHHEQKPIHEEVPRQSSSSQRESILSRVPFNRQQSHRSSANPDIKRYDTLRSVVIKHRDSLLDIRPSRTSIKPTNNNGEELSVITINVGGNRFQTYLSTLQLYPETLLGNENKRKQYWNCTTQEYFFDRHRACFESILYYYQSNGRLRRPDFVPLDTFLEEISFFQLGSDASDQVHKTENIRIVEQIEMPRMLWRRYIWFYFECPQHSLLARLINMLSMFFTVFSCLSLAIETLPTYNHQSDNLCTEQQNISLNSTFTPQCSTTFSSPFFIIQSICVIYFTIEFLLRLISTPAYFQFVLSFYNWIDLGSIVPYFVILCIELSNQDHNLNTNAILGIRLFRVLRFARVFKIYLVFRKLKTLRVLSSTIKESLVDFAVMITILTLIAFLFGAATYFAEHGTNSDVFDSIPAATYWGIITITGVGYGDMCPVTPIGRILACLCALVGASMMGMLVSVLVDRYQRVYNRKMYVPEPEVPAVDFSRRNSSQDATKTSVSFHKSSRIRQFSTAVSHRLSTVNRRLKHDHRRSSSQSYKVQFVVSFDGENIDDNEANDIVTAMKEKVTEAVSNTCTDINLKVIGNNNNNTLWTTDASNSLYNSTSNLITTTTSSDETINRWNSQSF